MSKSFGRIKKLLLKAMLGQPKILLLLIHNLYRKFSGAEKIIFDSRLRLFKIETTPPFFSRTRRGFLYRNGLNYRLEYLRDKYQLNQYDLSIQKVDLFIDCGSNIGELSRVPEFLSRRCFMH
jgi:hypothetical protein